jgi:uncharacterized membrane protein YhaH (DUF805 family)
MKILSFLYGFRGRIGRGKYWLGIAITLSFCVLLWLSAELSPSSGGGEAAYQSAISLLLFFLFILVPTWAALGTKRLHDRNKSGWWLLVFSVLPAVIFWYGTARQEPSLAAMAVSAALVLWGFIQLAFLPGTPGENAYGPSSSAGLTGPDRQPTLPDA